MNNTTMVAAPPAIDLPVPNRTTRITPPSAATVAHDNLKIGLIAAVIFVASALCFYMGHAVPAYILGGLGFVLAVSIFTKKSDVGECPYCSLQFRETVSVKDGLLRCEKCGEYSQVANKQVKPLNPSSFSDSPKYESPIFKQGSMPNVCASCGAAATRLDTVSTSSMNKTLAMAGAARLVTGAPGVAIFTSKQASISIPYCAQHRNNVTLSFDWRKRPVLTWSSLRMMRRYLAVNRGKEKY